MKGTLKRLLIFVLCMTLVVGESAVGAMAAEIDTTQVEISDEQESEMVSENENDEAVAEENGNGDVIADEEGGTDEDAVVDEAVQADEDADDVESSEETTEVVEDEIIEEVSEEAANEEAVLTATFTFDNTNGNLEHLRELYSRDGKKMKIFGNRIHSQGRVLELLQMELPLL